MINSVLRHSLDQDVHYFECICSAEHHTLRISIDNNLDDRDWPPEFCLSVQMVQWRGFWKRLWEAVLYILNRESHGYGHWDSFVLSELDIGRLTALLKTYDRYLNQWRLTGEKGA